MDHRQDAYDFITYPEVSIRFVTEAGRPDALAWDVDLGGGTVYARPMLAPESENEQIGVAERHRFVLPDGVAETAGQNRPLFTVVFENGAPSLQVARRFLPFEKGIHFRDVGGYQTASGQQVRWGQIYRSGALGDFTTADWAQFAGLEMRTVLDLRTTHEKVKKENNIPADMAHIYQHQPIYDERGGSRKWLRTFLFRRNRIEKVWLNDIYIGRLITKHAAEFGDVLKRMATDEKRPTLVHCTAGKDRTGISIALLLHILGVPRETIIDEYTLSNIDYLKLMEAIKDDADRLAYFGLKTRHIFPLLTANPAVLRETFAHIDRTYGSVDGYIRDRCGVGDEVRVHLRDRLLV